MNVLTQDEKKLLIAALNKQWAAIGLMSNWNGSKLNMEKRAALIAYDGLLSKLKPILAAK